MTRFSFLTLGLAVATLAGCKRDATFTEPLPSLAAIHWVNAVPDTANQDIHLVDIPSNAGLYNAAFRDANMFYQPIEAGSRRVKAFMAASQAAATGGNPAVAQTGLTEVTVTLNPNTSYTFIHQGFARTGQTPAKAGVLITDNPPTPAAGQIAVRIINAAAGLANVDVWVVKRAVNPATADSLPDARNVADVAFGAAPSAYLAFPVDGAGDATRVVVTAAGTKTPILAQVTAPVGVAGTATSDAIAGGTVAGTVFTAIVVPRSVAGSQAPQTLTTPGVVYLVDKRPPSTY